jgi:hypothetical protein
VIPDKEKLDISESSLLQFISPELFSLEREEWLLIKGI